jgi:ubiquitin-protein ligase
MLSEEKLNAMQTLKKKYNEIQRNKALLLNGCSIGLFDNNIFEWKMLLLAPRDSSYAGGIFTLKILFSEHYPDCPPEFYFLTPIYHLNVNCFKGNDLGYVYFMFTYCWNKNKTTIGDLITKLYTIFYIHNSDSTFIGKDRVNEYNNNRALFLEKVRYFTKKYATFDSPDYISYNTDKNWNFICNENELKISSIKSPNDYDFYPSNYYFKSPENDLKNQEINITMYFNGKDIPIKCYTDEPLGNAINRAQILEYSKRYIILYQAKTIDPSSLIKDIGLRNNDAFIMISFNMYFGS